MTKFGLENICNKQNVGVQSSAAFTGVYVVILSTPEDCGVLRTMLLSYLNFRKWKLKKNLVLIILLPLWIEWSILEFPY